jgi:predicted small integral membrane protein
MRWMAWTAPTALFFACIIATLVAMAVWELRAPTVLRRGFLPMPTTRGDRLFIGLLATAFVHMAWLGLTDMAPWPALGASLLLMLVIGRWG